MSRPSLLAENQPIKVWQPADFEGLYLEKFQGQRQQISPVVLFDYSIQVAFSGNTRLHYGKTQQIVKITQPTVFLQNPGETWAYKALDDTLITAKNFDISGEFFSCLLDKDIMFHWTSCERSRSLLR